ncbi:MAG: L-malate glycosyltransferase [Pseudomonadota bacterium]|nr:L-malate glycosyltransferase [Pseudomonadota bacterium]
MNILVFCSANSSFNSIRPEAEIYIGLAKRGHNLTVVTHGSTEYAQRLREHGIEVIDGHPKYKLSIRSIRLIRKLLTSRDYDILYATNSKTIPNAAFASIGLPIKLIAYRGTTRGLYRHDPGTYLTLLHPRIDGIICVSDAVRDYVTRQVWGWTKNIVTIHKGHDISWYNKPEADLSQFGITENDFTAICVINARPSKGLSVMLEATGYLAHLERLHLLLVGKNINTEPYTTLINNSKMKARIHVAGYRNDAPELIAASDILIQPSISGEGLPRTVMEAMGYGTPAVITTTGGGKEVIQNGVNGYIVPVKDPEAIAERVMYLYNNPEELKKLSMNCKNTLRTTFSLETTIDNYIKYFESIIRS